MKRDLHLLIRVIDDLKLQTGADTKHVVTVHA